jgi:hypothetical protein
VARLHASFDQFLLDGKKILLLRTEHVDALTARDLRIEAVLLGYPANHDQLVRSDLTSCNAGDYAESTISLEFGEILAVGILEAVQRLVEDVLVIQRCKNGANGRLGICFTMNCWTYAVCSMKVLRSCKSKILTRWVWKAFTAR